MWREVCNNKGNKMKIQGCPFSPLGGLSYANKLPLTPMLFFYFWIFFAYIHNVHFEYRPSGKWRSTFWLQNIFFWGQVILRNFPWGGFENVLSQIAHFASSCHQKYPYLLKSAISDKNFLIFWAKWPYFIRITMFLWLK